jgi:hypothetical protein
MTENALMIVLTTYDLSEAHVIAGLLESEGIRALVQQEPAGSALGITIGILGEVRVLVLAADYERAVALIEADDIDELPADADQIIFDADDTP